MPRLILGEVNLNQFEDSLEEENNENVTKSTNTTFEIKNKPIFYEIPNTPVLIRNRKRNLNSKIRDEIRKSLNNTVTLRKTIEKQQLDVKENKENSSKSNQETKSTNLTKIIDANQINTNSTYIKQEKKEIKNKEKICDVIYLKTIDNLLNAVNTELDFGKLNYNFKDDINYINVFQENLTKLTTHLRSKINYNAGLKIVRWYKNRLEIRKAKEILNQLRLEDQRKKAVIVLQKNWRRYKAQSAFSKLVDKKLNERTKAILVVQRNCRVYLAKKKLQKLRKEAEERQSIKNVSALIIQRNWRSHLFRCRLNVAIENAKTERAIQKHVLNLAAAVIQKSWKVYQFKKSLTKLVEERRLLNNQSALVIQKTWKSYRFRNTIGCLIEERRSKLENEACLRIQNAWRNYLFRKHLNKMIELRRSRLQVESALMIQRNWRKFSFRLNLDRAIKERRSRIENQSALMIQRFWKSYRLRNTIKCLIERRSEVKNRACLIIQRAWRSYSSKLKHKSAVIIQSAWRIYQAKRQLKLLKSQNASAQIIQRNWRSYLLKKNLNRQININQLRRLDDAALMIQKTWRGYLVRKKVKEQLIEQRKASAAVKIQKLWRGHATRVKCLHNNKDKRLSGIFERINEANKRSINEPKIGEKTKLAIQKLLTYRYQNKIISVLKELESTTNLSNESCIQMANQTVIEVLLQVVRECNRSEPSLEIIKIVFSIILNIAKNDKALPLLSSLSILKEATIETLNKHYKITGIFLKAMTLLYILLKYDNFSCETPAFTVKIKRLLNKISDEYTYSSNRNKKKIYQFDARFLSKKNLRPQFYNTKQTMDAFYQIYSS